MEQKKIYKRLRNGKTVDGFCRMDESNTYSLHLSYDKDGFKLHSYYFVGNDVMDEDNYKDEKIKHYEDFDLLMTAVCSEFPKTEFK